MNRTFFPILVDSPGQALAFARTDYGSSFIQLALTTPTNLGGQVRQSFLDLAHPLHQRIIPFPL